MTLQPSESRLAFLNLRHFPARLCTEEAGWLLGFSSEEVAILSSEGLLKVLGSPTLKGRKWYAASCLLPLIEDQAWLSAATLVVATHWRKKNSK